MRRSRHAACRGPKHAGHRPQATGTSTCGTCTISQLFGAAPAGGAATKESCMRACTQQSYLLAVVEVGAGAAVAVVGVRACPAPHLDQTGPETPRDSHCRSWPSRIDGRPVVQTPGALCRLGPAALSWVLHSIAACSCCPTRARPQAAGGACTPFTCVKGEGGKGLTTTALAHMMVFTAIHMRSDPSHDLPPC